MSSSADAREQALEVAERLAPLGPVIVKRMFSGAGLSIDGVNFAFVIGGTLYFRVDDQSRPAYEAMGLEPFRYDRPGRTVTVGSYYEAPDEVFDDDEALCDHARAAWQAALTASRARPPKKPRAPRRRAAG
ncbi:TfoX/Sxy family protein [Tistrella mobilis]